MDGTLATTAADSPPGKGDVITYKATVENTGTTCLRQLNLSDDLDAFAGCQSSGAGKPRSHTNKCAGTGPYRVNASPARFQAQTASFANGLLPENVDEAYVP